MINFLKKLKKNKDKRVWRRQNDVTLMWSKSE